MVLTIAQRRLGVPRFPTHNLTWAATRRLTPRRTLIPAPAANSGPITERRADRELPSIQTEGRRWISTLPIFAIVVGAAMLGIFNYQKSSSSVVSSTLYALRTSPRAREILGDQIYFAQQIPWISGEMNQLHGRIDISFWVKGTKAQGKMRFRSIRPDRMSFFRTEEWSLTTEDGTVVQLLEDNHDPFSQQ
ncbi:cytochrome oxidase complex assembly protein 1-domain-containing protein [Aspergillus carlsbadensis]|nr:cytochrome oxidase complex assembly protein 1-domain-containing protein [Aspergillus carlsbadensis]